MALGWGCSRWIGVRSSTRKQQRWYDVDGLICRMCCVGDGRKFSLKGKPAVVRVIRDSKISRWTVQLVVVLGIHFLARMILSQVAHVSDGTGDVERSSSLTGMHVVVGAIRESKIRGALCSQEIVSLTGSTWTFLFMGLEAKGSRLLLLAKEEEQMLSHTAQWMISSSDLLLGGARRSDSRMK